MSLAIFALVTPVILKFGLGLRFDVMESGSMSPKIHVGDLVVSSRSNDIKENDLARYYEPNRTIPTIHRVIRIEDRDGETVYRTKGDANQTEDLYILPESAYKQKVIMVVGGLWGFWGIMHEIQIVLIAFGIVGAVLAVFPWKRFVVLKSDLSSSENTP